jgi:hypothetical protein
MFKHLSSVVCAFFLSVCVPAHGQDAAAGQLVYFYPNVYRISAENRITTVSLPQNRDMTLSMAGSTIPVVSPDQRWIAFIKENDLWMYNTQTQAMRRVTRVGRPYTETLASVLVLMVVWSADSTRVLINVTAGDTECVDCNDRGDWKKRKADYGHFVYDVRSGALHKIVLPKDFDLWDWRADGRLLGASITGEDQGPVMVTPGGKPQPVPGLEGRGVNGLRISRDGSWAVAIISEYGRSYPVRVNLRTGALVMLTDEGRFAEYQDLTISPGEEHVSWVHRTGPVNAGTKQIVVDGQPGFTCASELLIHDWLDERRMIVNCGGKLQVVDGGTGRQLEGGDREAIPSRQQYRYQPKSCRDRSCSSEWAEHWFCLLAVSKGGNPRSN